MKGPAVWLLDLLYPPKCVMCRRLLRRDERDVCTACLRALPLYGGSPAPGPWCRGAVAALRYEGDVRSSLLRFKFGGMEQYAGCYGRLLAAACERLPLAEIDAVTWVPVSRRRRRKRGYDQARLLAAALARELGKPLVPALRKCRDNPPQSSLEEAARRRANVLGAYRVLPACAGKRLLLVDDIRTTGATLDEAARVLLTGGAGAVWQAVLAARPDGAPRQKGGPNTDEAMGVTEC